MFRERRGCPSIMVNTKHDTTSYENCSYQREIYDGNALHDAFLKSRKGSAWKPQVQKFRMNYLTELASISTDMKNRTYTFSPTSEFILHERGRVRPVVGEQIRDRVAEHSLCDEFLTPLVRPKLVYDNGASLEGKGIDFTRNRLLVHLRKYYAEHKTNDGYILLIDFSKYYDNILHDRLLEMYSDIVYNDTAFWFIEQVLKQSEVDVSYMSEEEFENCLDVLFNSLDYFALGHEVRTGEKFMKKHLNIGSQPAQSSGILYSTPFDNYIKIVKSEKYFGRYMDDSYVIHRDKEHLQELLKELVGVAESLGITINMKKTRIVPLSSYWRYLQIQYSLTDTGRVVRKINPKRLTAMRRKMKKLAPQMQFEPFKDWFYSWFNNHCKIMSKQQRNNMLTLFKEVSELCLS